MPLNYATKGSSRDSRGSAGVKRNSSFVDLDDALGPGSRSVSFVYPESTCVKRCKSISEVLDVHEELGSGSYATVMKCLDKELLKQENKAVKLIDESVYNKSKKQLQTEVSILSDFPNSPHILSMDHVVRVPGKCFGIVTELASGDLFHHIVEHPNRRLSELEAKKILWQLVDGVEALHSKNIVHRDLKPENILLVNNAGSSNGDISVKIADFGLATYVKPGVPLYRKCGTTGYSAPEVLTKSAYGKPCDLWSIGVVMYAMLHGYLPFNGSKEEMTESIIRGKYRFSRSQTFSDHAYNLMKSLMNGDSAQRPTITEMRENPWFDEMRPKEKKMLRPRRMLRQPKTPAAKLVKPGFKSAIKIGVKP